MNAPMAPGSAAEFPPALNVRRLLLIRSIAIPGAALWLAAAGPAYGLEVPVALLTAMAATLLLMNGVLWRQAASGRPVGNRALFAQLALDLLALTGILVATGGPANPLVLFFLLPLTIAAAILPQRYAWVIAVLSACCYTSLLVVRHLVRDPLAPPERVSSDLHTVGMWLGFVVIAGLMAHFVAAMAETLRQRDRDLARAREAALRDEQVLAVATLAAGAAHELSTPLATMAVVAGELAAQYPDRDHPGLGRQVGLLRDQIARCKDALSVLSASAGAARADHVEQLTLAQFVGRAVDEVCHLRPAARIRLETATTAGPLLALDRRAYQALLNVLNNAVDASPDDVTVAARWTAGGLEIAVVDRGSGLPAGAPPATAPVASTKQGGLGLGLFLSRAALGQLGGELVTEANPAGGTTVRLRFASSRLTESIA